MSAEASPGILLLADSHLGFDLPSRPRTDRRRRGHDFLDNYHRALEPARNGEADAVVHAGDVFDRPNVAPSVAYQAYEPLRRVAESGIPVFIVPGNHERSRLPHRRLLAHPNIHVFDQPRTVVVNLRGMETAFSGFPYESRDVRTRFPALLEETNWKSVSARHRLLCVHHCVEGATVGPADYVFTTASDVIRHRDIPRELAAVFTGHVHRHQVLEVDLAGRSVPTPVLYPGSIERTAFAEASETKGFMLVRLALHSESTEILWEFRPLPARPMLRVEIVATDDAERLFVAVRDAIGGAPEDAVLTLRVHGELNESQWNVLSAKSLRALAPSTMNVDVVPVDVRAAGRERWQERRPSATMQPHTDEQLALL